ncbi:MAG: transcription termination factor NusA [Myxococcota bacterium]
MLSELSRVIEQVGKDKGIEKSILIEALESAMITAAKKKYGAHREIEAQFNEEAGEIELFEFKTVVEDVEEPDIQITLAEARKLDPGAEMGDSLGMKMESKGFGRIAAQTAKQVIIQRVRDAERDLIYNEYKDRKGEIVNGIVRRFEKGNMIVDLGRAEAIMPVKEQIPRESYRPSDRARGLIVDVQKVSKGPQIVMSRANGEFLIKLFEQEVPEMHEGIVNIVAAAREPGGRAKVAVASRDSDVDPVGACVGVKGSRVQSVVQELRGEKIDIVAWSPDTAKFVCNALAPAQVSKVILEDESKQMDIVVPDDQLSLAIGKRGQNVRLAVLLTGWKIDIKSETKTMQEAEAAKVAFMEIPGMTDIIAQVMINQGVTSVAELADIPLEALASFPGIGQELAERLRGGAADPEIREKAEAAAQVVLDAQAAAEAEARAAREAEKEAQAAAAERAESADEDAPEHAADALENLGDLKQDAADALKAAGIVRIQDILNATQEELKAVEWLEEQAIPKIVEAAQEYQAHKIRTSAKADAAEKKGEE